MKPINPRLFKALLAAALWLSWSGLLPPKEAGSEIMSDKESIRKPAVADQFYPADPGRLRADIREFLSNADVAPPAGRILALVSPHAGYVYSGQVAAHGYKLLQAQGARTVIVISPSHVEFFPFASIYGGGGYETPLGVIPVDKELANRIASNGDLVRLSDKGHLQERLSRQEHALEVQLPFLQCVLGSFSVVPIVMGDQSWEICEALGEAIAPVLKEPGAVIVASSDLSHFHPEKTARSLDSAFCGLLEKMDAELLYEGIEDRSFEACGAGPVIASILACTSAGTSECRILATATSADASGDRSSVVGYASAVITAGGTTSRNEKQSEDRHASGADEFTLSPQERRHLLALARRAIAEHLGLGSAPVEPAASPLFEEKSGAFVTIKMQGQLRGCIGYIEALRPLKTAIAEMARAAAFDDPRFAPLTKEEYPRISIEISVLSPLRLISDPETIEVGRHGLVVEQGMHRGLLLPQVAAEYGWNRTQFLEHTCQKAMLPAAAWKDPRTRIYAFSAEVFGEAKK
ncbi:MAG: AmmeMemoRadiSam system protein B [Chitinivibrionia bacterium]|nr:AmmeMemoRadiSam system protein B [Chitinivibrionia bacterium]